MLLALELLKKMRKEQQISVNALFMINVSFCDDLADGSSNDSSEDSSDDWSCFNPMRKVRKMGKMFKNWKSNDIAKLFIEVVKISRQTTMVSLKSCELLPAVYTHVSKQLYGCEKLNHLFLSSTKGVPASLGRSIATMKLLRLIDLSDCEMTKSVGRSVLKELSHCHQLVHANLSNNCLSDCMKYLFNGTNHPGFALLEGLLIDDTELNGSDMKSLLVALSNGKLPKLEDLSCDAGIIVTDCLRELLGAVHHPAFPFRHEFTSEKADVSELIEWYLEETRPSKDDVSIILGTAKEGKLRNLTQLNLSQDISWLSLWKTSLTKVNVRELSNAVRCEKLPQLKELCLDGNSMKGCVRDLMGGVDHPGFPSLEELSIAHAKLSKDDIHNLSEAVISGKLHKLKKLNLEGNRLAIKDKEVENLLEVCVATYRKQIVQIETD